MGNVKTSCYTLCALRRAQWDLRHIDHDKVLSMVSLESSLGLGRKQNKTQSTETSESRVVHIGNS